MRAVLPCCPGFARSPRPQRMWVHSWGSATQHGAGCGVQVCGGVGSRGRWSWMRRSSARCGCRLRSSVGKVRWWGMAMGSAPERGDGEGHSRLFYLLLVQLHFTSPRGYPEATTHADTHKVKAGVKFDLFATVRVTM